MKTKNLLTIILSYVALLGVMNLSAQISPTPEQTFLRTPGVAPVGSTLGTTYYKGLNNNGIITIGASIRATVSQKANSSVIPTTLDFLTGLNELKSRFQISDNGLIGINTSKPNSLLSIHQFENDAQTAKLFEVVGGVQTSPKAFQLFSENNLLKVDYQGHFLQREGDFRLQDGSLSVDKGNFFVKAGKVAIGLENQELVGSHKLYVDGSIVCTELNVDLKSNWPDFVFKKDYFLMPLADLEAFINKENHLPEVPSHKHVKNNGINVGEMQAVLLQKIEELTLYIIEQNKRIETLECQAQKIKKQNAKTNKIN